MLSRPQLPFDVGLRVLDYLQVPDPLALHRMGSTALCRPENDPLSGLWEAARSDAAWRKWSPKAVRSDLYGAFRQRVVDEPSGWRALCLYKCPKPCSNELTVQETVTRDRNPPPFDLTLARILRARDFDLALAPDEQRDEPAIAFAAVGRNPSALAHVSKDLGQNRELFRSALEKSASNTYFALHYIPDSLRDDRALFLEVINRYPHGIEAASDRLHADRKLMLDAARKAPEVLGLIRSGLPHDRTFVLSLLQHNPHALPYLTPELQQDHEVNFAALRAGARPESLHPTYWGDKTFNLELVRQGEFQSTNPRLQYTPSFLLTALDVDPKIFDFFTSGQQRDRELCLGYVKKTGYFHPKMMKKWQRDKEFRAHVRR